MLFDAVLDVQTDGRVTNVFMKPDNAWTACLAKSMELTWKLPPPPKLANSAAYPLVYQVKLN